jgi:hypothetical protein
MDAATIGRELASRALTDTLGDLTRVGLESYFVDEPGRSASQALTAAREIVCSEEGWTDEQREAASERLGELGAHEWVLRCTSTSPDYATLQSLSPSVPDVTVQRADHGLECERCYRVRVEEVPNG